MERQREQNLEKGRIERLISMKGDMISQNEAQLNYRQASTRNQQYQYSLDKVRDNQKYTTAPLSPMSDHRGLENQTAKLLSPKRLKNDQITLYN